MSKNGTGRAFGIVRSGSVCLGIPEYFQMGFIGMEKGREHEQETCLYLHWEILPHTARLWRLMMALALRLFCRGERKVGRRIW
ncbi:MAG: hypothetical protein ACLR8P_16515 [Clostridium fessum]